MEMTESTKETSHMEGVVYSAPQFCNDLLQIWQAGRGVFDKCITAHTLIFMRLDATAKVLLLLTRLVPCKIL